MQEYAPNVKLMTLSLYKGLRSIKGIGSCQTPEIARNEAANTLAEVKAAMRINYFEDVELIRSQAERFSK